MKRPRFHPIAWSVIIGTFLGRAGFFMTMPFLALYLQDTESPSTIGAILGSSFLVGTFSSFFGGALSDRVGRYPVMIVSMFAWCLVFVGFALAQSTWIFFVLSALNGLFRNIFEPTARALLTDVTPEDQQLAVFNARYFGINAGASLGPLAGLLFGSAHSTMPFLITACIYGAYGVMIVVLRAKYGEQKKAPEQAASRVTIADTTKVIFFDKVFRYFLIANMFVCMAYAHMESTVPQYLGASKWFANGVGFYATLLITNCVAVVLLQYPLTRLMKNVSTLTCLKIGSICFALGVWGFGVFHALPLLILSMAVFTVGEILCNVIGDVLIAQIAPDHLRGAYFGASGFQFIGQAVGPWVGGLLLNAFGFESGVLVFGILALLSGLAYPFFQLGQNYLAKRQTQHADTPATIAR